MPSLAQVKEGLTFAHRFVGGRLLVQCEAGNSRSGTFAAAIFADRLGVVREADALEAALAGKADIIPNLAIVDYWRRARPRRCSREDRS